MAIVHLSAELISKVLESEDINIKDVINFSATCKQFRHIIINNNNLWRKKFCQRWPTARKDYEKKIGISFYHININDVKAATKCTKELWKYVSHMSKRHYYYFDDAKCLKDFNSLFLSHKHCLDAHPMHSVFLKDELIRNIYTQSPWQCDLTQRYYSIKLLQCLITKKYLKNWKKFDNKSHQKQILEKLFTIVMQWCRPEKYIYYLHIDKFIDDIMQEVLKHLREEKPTHKIFSISPEQFSFWKYNNINENYWGEIEARQIKCLLDKIILNWSSYNLNYPWKIDQIRESYTSEFYNEKLLWLITYTCVARRMGIHMEIAEHLSECLMHPLNVYLVWKPRGHTEETACFNFLMDRLSNRPIALRCTCRLISNPVKMSMNELVLAQVRVFKNYIPKNMSIFSVLAICVYDVMRTHIRIKKCCKRRSHKIKFAVGMVIQYKRGEGEDSKDYVGVIIGWHNKYQIRMHSYSSRHSFFHRYLDILHYDTSDHLLYLPFYIVLMDDDYDMTYVPQSDIISVCTSQRIDNPEIGRYFCKFEKTHYVPNKMLARNYPQDAAVVLETFNNL